MEYLAFFLCFVLAAIVAHFGLNSKYTNTNFLLKRYLPYYCYSCLWGVFAIVTYAIMILIDLHITIAQTDIDSLNYSPYIKAIFVGLFTKSVFEGFNFNYSTGSEDKTLGFKIISDLFESSILKKIQDEHRNLLKEFCAERQKGYIELQTVISTIEQDLDRHTDEEKYFSKTYMLDLNENIIDLKANPEINVRRVMEDFLLTFGKRTFDRLFPKK